MTFALSLASCASDAPTKQTDAPPTVEQLPRYEPTPTIGADTFVVTEGTLRWLGKKNIGGEHTGTIQVKDGFLLVNGTALAAGRITIDMHSIVVTDLQDPRERADLEAHLKDNDFFDVKKYPQGEFLIREVAPSHMDAFNTVVSGTLTLKGISKNINIPVRLDIKDDELKAESPAFMINRTHWGINFQSGIIGTAKDKLIDDNVPIQLSLRAKSKRPN